MRSLIEKSQRCEIPAEVALVVAPSSEAPALEVARSLGVSVAVIPAKTESFGDDLIRALREAEVDVICLAGFMRLLPSSVLAAFGGKVLNVHPALLPKFGGKGMYGMHVHEAVLAAGETESGATVHWVTEEYDEGAPLVQLRCPVRPDDTPETLAARVLEKEHEAYAEAIRKVAEAS